ncbi:T9SS type A sorting domain-containing protein, partial [candidate division WOR-3 bacterium]|nr:T9SS type A sorting domain-containing protein [candidate division WOR-3 bacterium]
LYCTDALDSNWVSPATLVVSAPVLARQGVTVVDSAHGGNNNGVFDPGETADLMVTLGNSGTGHGYSCHAVLRSGDARVTVVDSTATFGLIPSSDSASNATDLFTVHAAGTVFPETPIPCTLYCYADGGYTKSEPFILTVGQLQASDPIPDGPRMPALYYAYDDTDTLYPAHPSYDWVEVNTVGTPITFVHHNSVVMVTLPAGFGPLKFYGQEFTQLSVSADGWICPGNRRYANAENVELPDQDNPPGMVCANWTDLYPVVGDSGAGQVYYYHDTANHRFIVEYDSVRYRTNTTRDKFEVVFSDTTVATYSGDNAILVQHMTANGYAGSTVGLEDPDESVAVQAFYKGDYHRACAPLAPERAILYTTDPPFAAGVWESSGSDAVPTGLALSVRPSPLRSRAAIEYAVPAAGRIGIKVYDAAGRVVRDLVSRYADAGSYSVTWDGRAADGRRVARGVYFCKLSTPAGTRQQKLVVTE